MSHETVLEVQESEKQNLGCSARVSETVIAIPEEDSDEAAVEVVRDSENRSSDSGESCAAGIVTEAKVAENCDENKSWGVVDVKCKNGELDCDGEMICRICHLSSEQPWKLPFFAAKTDVILLGCGCKGELSVAHSYCAEAWFKLKGNRKVMKKPADKKRKKYSLVKLIYHTLKGRRGSLWRERGSRKSSSSAAPQQWSNGTQQPNQP